MAFAAGQRLTAQLLNSALGATVGDTQATLANFTIATGSYTETFTTSNTPAAVAFVAPTSGIVLIHNRSWLDNSGATARTLMSFVVRTGSTVGSGTTFLAASDARAIHNTSADDIECGATFRVTGLTPGAAYNVRQAGRVTSGTGESQNREIIVEPVT
jgi:hypothetical protein